jgi:pimeloyl-ACP methyl ester carboxylesterase
VNTPHERLTRTTFSLPLGEVHALVGGAVNARPLLFLHGFPDHPPTAVPFLEHLAETHRVVAPWLRGYAPSPIVGPYDLDTLAADALALIDGLGGQVDLVGQELELGVSQQILTESYQISARLVPVRSVVKIC